MGGDDRGCTSCDREGRMKGQAARGAKRRDRSRAASL